MSGPLVTGEQIAGIPWRRDVAEAPRDGNAFLAFGTHTEESIRRDDAPVHKGIVAGDHWWAIILWDVWRKGVPSMSFRDPDPARGAGRFVLRTAEPTHRWAFAKDGAPAWTEPEAWSPLDVPGWVPR